MEHKVFYGDYSLKHWIDLMLEGRIVIPEFQRTFVWEKEDIQDLMESFKNNSFIPPVMIGAYNKDGNNKNNNKIDDWIIDGQQRLSSILLAWLNKFPPKPPKKKNDKSGEDEEETFIWDFEKIQNDAKEAINNCKITDREDLKIKIAENLKIKGYSELNLNSLNPKDIFSKCRLGFSYIKPNEKTGHEEQKRFYAELFRNINTKGVDLSNMEAREALYWVSGLRKFFVPDFAENIKVDEKQLDFARILALLSEYKKCSASSKIDFNDIAKRYGGKKFEAYIVLYIESLINGNNKRFDIKIPNDYENRINKIKNYIREKKYPSIIDADYWLFGLVYFILFEDRDIDISREKDLKEEIEEKTDKDKISYYEKKMPSSLKYIRKRLEESIDIYGRFTSYEIR